LLQQWLSRDRTGEIFDDTLSWFLCTGFQVGLHNQIFITQNKPDIEDGLSRGNLGLGKKYPKFLVSRDIAVVASGYITSLVARSRID
jgi:hypothetical protein